MGEFPGGEPKKTESVVAIEAATKSFLESRRHGIEDDTESFSLTGCECEYPVADLLGRCFLRVCFWADLFAYWTRREWPLPVRAAAAHAPADPRIEDASTIPAKPRVSASTLGG